MIFLQRAESIYLYDQNFLFAQFVKNVQRSLFLDFLLWLKIDPNEYNFELMEYLKR
jgi:hypothetical protein